MMFNVGFEFIFCGGEEEVVRERVTEALRVTFRSEFLNRVDEIVIFGRLSQEQLVEQGYDLVYGVRPLKRTLQRELENPFVMFVFQGEVGDGDTVVVDAVEGIFLIVVCWPTTAAA